MQHNILPNHLPKPDPLSHDHSQKVAEFIKGKIKQAPKQHITFAEYMHYALYAPGLGYYVAGNQKFGPSGDFITAPEIAVLFSQCLAQQCAQVLELVGPQAEILEFGAGSGVMAADILVTLAQQHCLPKTYFILEVSAELKARQQQTIQQKCGHLLHKVQWLQHLPKTPIKGIILANEVLDAMPVHRFQLSNQTLAQEYYVGLKQKDFCWELGELSSTELTATVASLQAEYLVDCGIYSSEVCLMQQPWLQSVSESLAQGVILLIDYGYLAAEYYHPQRIQGTLACHFRHHTHANPLLYPGIQDLTAHVNFSTLMSTAEQAKLKIVGYSNQAHFLINCGLGQLQQAFQAVNQDPVALMDINKGIKLLTFPTEMGELFKVLALSRKIDEELLGFRSIR